MGLRRIVIATMSEVEEARILALGNVDDICPTHIFKRVVCDEQDDDSTDLTHADFAAETQQFADFVRTEEADVVIIGALSPIIPHGTIELARFLTAHSTAKVVLVFTMSPSSGVCNEVVGSAITATGMLHFCYYGTLHPERMWSQLIKDAREALDDLDDYLGAA